MKNQQLASSPQPEGMGQRDADKRTWASQTRLDSNSSCPLVSGDSAVGAATPESGELMKRIRNAKAGTDSWASREDAGRLLGDSAAKMTTTNWMASWREVEAVQAGRGGYEVLVEGKAILPASDLWAERPVELDDNAHVMRWGARQASLQLGVAAKAAAALGPCSGRWPLTNAKVSTKTIHWPPDAGAVDGVTSRGIPPSVKSAAAPNLNGC